MLDVPALTKEAAFIDLCDSFNIPLVFFQDVPGLMIGTEAERGGILHGYERVVAGSRGPRCRSSPSWSARPTAAATSRSAAGPPTRTCVLAWPTAEMGFMAPGTGVRTVYRRSLEETLEAEEPRGRARRAGRRAGRGWAAESEPWEAAAHVYIDDVIDPRTTREAVATGSTSRGAAARA